MNNQKTYEIKRRIYSLRLEIVKCKNDINDANELGFGMEYQYKNHLLKRLEEEKAFLEGLIEEGKLSAIEVGNQIDTILISGRTIQTKKPTEIKADPDKSNIAEALKSLIKTLENGFTKLNNEEDIE